MIFCWFSLNNLNRSVLFCMERLWSCFSLWRICFHFIQFYCKLFILSICWSTIMWCFSFTFIIVFNIFLRIFYYVILYICKRNPILRTRVFSLNYLFCSYFLSSFSTHIPYFHCLIVSIMILLSWFFFTVPIFHFLNRCIWICFSASIHILFICHCFCTSVYIFKCSSLHLSISGTE